LASNDAIADDGAVTSGGDLQRRLGVADAVVIGAGSMIGAGVFAAWSPAADAAGTGLVVGLLIAGVVAFCNAASSAQLAAVHPQSGGTYVYGRRQLGAFWGHLAGWGFVVGKTASCAAMALTVGAYLWPDQDRAVAVVAIVAITVVNIGGLSRTVAVTRVLLAVSLVALAAVVVAGWTDPDASLDRLTPIDAGWREILQSAGFLFFAFAGYARIATLGEEVKDPADHDPASDPASAGRRTGGVSRRRGHRARRGPRERPRRHLGAAAAGDGGWSTRTRCHPWSTSVRASPPSASCST
jgi:basic amino acid/polyamine antiporter, APA family